MEVTLLKSFLLNPMYYQNEIWSNTSAITICITITNISNMFLAQYWRLEASSMPFYEFIKMAI